MANYELASSSAGCPLREGGFPQQRSKRLRQHGPGTMRAGPGFHGAQRPPVGPALAAISTDTTKDISERLETEAERIADEDRQGVDPLRLHRPARQVRRRRLHPAPPGASGTSPTRTGILASAIGMDKDIQQDLRAEGLGVPMSTVVRPADKVKPGRRPAPYRGVRLSPGDETRPEGSSIGVTVVPKPEGLDAAMASALEWDRTVLVEEFLDGTEFSSIVLEDEGEPRPLALTEIHPQQRSPARQVHAGAAAEGRCRPRRSRRMCRRKSRSMS